MPRRELALLIVFMIGTAGVLVADDPPLITVSVETTRIVKPLRADGSVDFIADLNRRMSEDVTPENNAAVPLLRASGHEMLGRHSARYCEMLGIPKVKTEGIIPFERFEVPTDNLQLRMARREEYYQAINQPWKATDYPDLARWLNHYAAEFQLIEEASRRTRYYTPQIPEDIEHPAVSTVLLPQAQELRQLARHVSARCMFRLGQGDAKGAIEDVQLIHRLAVLQGRGFMPIEGLVSISIDMLALSSSVQIAQSPALTPGLAGELIKELKSWGPCCSIADAFDLGDRYMFIDSLSTLALDPDVHILEDKESEAPLRRLAQVPGVADEALRIGNRRYDDVVAALRLASPRERRKALLKLETEISQIQLKIKGTSNPIATLLLGSTKSRGETLGEIMLAFSLSAFSEFDVASERSLSKRDMVCIFLALRHFQGTKGRLPASLDALVPDHLSALPVDRLTGEALRYHMTSTSVVVSSSGKNGIYDVDLSQPPPSEPTYFPPDDVIMSFQLPE